MKLGLIRKSLVCVLSITFGLTLASCKMDSKEATVSTTNVFKNADVLAYAKNSKIVRDTCKTEVCTIDASKYYLYSSSTYYNILRDKETGTTMSL